jgi:hypothetical protein
MRNGPIRPEVRTSDIDRRNVSYAMWEQTVGVSPGLPWAPASSLGAQEVATLLATCRTAVLVVGRRKASAALLEHALASVPPSGRLYVYGPRALETNARIPQQLGVLSERVLPRLGLDAPADWLVVDSGRAALLLIGPSHDERRLLVRADGALARTLFEAFRALFWFHATREGLPDTGGTYAFRTPLPAPFPDPGADIVLPSGRIAIGKGLPDAIADAEIRIVPGGAAPDRADIVFVPPDPKSFASPMRLARDMARVVWLDTGLPRTSVSRERLVFDLVEAPIALQLEWPKKDAIELYHRLSRCAQKPEWQFHAQRRLADVAGRVLLEGATAPAGVRDSEVVQAADVIAPLDAFDGVQPDEFPEPPPLARRVTYEWSARPRTLPAGARKAELVRRWRDLDEWARRQVDTLRQTLAGMEGAEHGLLERVRARLSGHDALRQRRSRIQDELEELGEAPPSQHFAGAGDLVRRIAEAGREVRGMLDEAHRARLAAEDAVAEAEQRAAWQARTQRAAEELAAKRAELGSLELRVQAAAVALEEAEKTQKAAEVKRARKARDAAQEAVKRVSVEIRGREQRASEPFAFQAPARPPGPALPPEAAAPAVPEEAPPELGELFEHRNQRYLAVKTWDQVPRAVPVARRLQSVLVSSSEHAE